MKKIIIAVSVIALTVSAVVTSAVIKRNTSTILNQNVEALLDGEISVGNLCAYQPGESCVYHDPFGTLIIIDGYLLK